MQELGKLIVQAAANPLREVLLQPFSLGGGAQNELLFFFKPECFVGTTSVQQSKLVDTALSLFSTFSVTLAGALLFTGLELAKRGVIERHYGLINRVSCDAHSLSEDELLDIKKQAGAEQSTPIFGGHQFLRAFPDYSSDSLFSLWATKSCQRWRSGIYFEAFDLPEGPLILLNGFHPAQVAHYTNEGRAVVLLVLQSDLPWTILRTDMLGDTFPDKAPVGSLRRTLHDQPERFGFRDVSISTNASHLSAGPFEAMFELSNLLSSSAVSNFDVESTKIWKTGIRLGLERERLESAISNPVSTFGGKERTLFDATEETDTLSAMHLFQAQW